MKVRELGEQLRSRKLSCIELIEQAFSDIAKRECYRSFITLMEEEARSLAVERDRELAAGLDRGPLHGIPIALKDLFYTRGVRTTGGSLLYRDFVPSHDGTVVEHLKTAGAICVGKTNLHELAYGITSSNPHFGAVLNPIDSSRIPGGSSGGSAALVAGGFLPVALGTDTGGSIRIPASYCGITGLKPTYGRVSRYGVLPLSFSLDHVGPLGACVDDCALAMNAIAGPDPLDRSCVNLPAPDFSPPPLGDLQGVRVGVPKNFFFERIDEQVNTAVRASIAEMDRLGASVAEVRIPDLNEANAAARVIQLSEVASLYARFSDRSLFGKDVWNLIEQGRMIAAHEYVSAQRIRTLFRRDFDALWKNLDVLVTPATPIVAPRLDEVTVPIGSESENTRMASTRLVRAVNFLGEPALCLPCGTNSEGLPIGLQIIGPPFSEPRLLQIGRTLEATSFSH